MAWSPARRANAGIDRVGQPGDYATPNSNQPRDATLSEAHLVSSQSSSGAVCSVNSALSGLKVRLFAGWQKQRWKRGLASGPLPNGVRKVRG